MEAVISVIGGANVDLSATLTDAFIAADSNPGHIEIGYGGVARNIAHNLALLGARTQLMTVFGDDLFADFISTRTRFCSFFTDTISNRHFVDLDIYKF